MTRDAALPAGFEDLRGRDFQGRYAIDELVHASTWRVSFAGREHNGERRVVVELVRPSRAHDQTTLERFERRVAACKRVRHPAVSGPLDAGELGDGKLWVASERPAGEPLATYLPRHAGGRFEWMDARPLLLALVRGLAAAHARHVVHGALNPSCCWVDRPDFGVPSLRVLGFGVNTTPAAADADLGHSRTTALAYDAVFMAPETAGGIFGDERSDVYLVGLVAWLMLVGRPPFLAANPFQNAAMHLTAPLPAMRDARADVPEGVEALVRSMLAKKPAQRIGGMAEVEQVIVGLDEGGEGRDVGGAAEPEGARGRRGRARARQAGAASREEAVQRLGEQGARGGMPRLPGQEIVDAGRGTVRPPQAAVTPTIAPPVSAVPVASLSYEAPAPIVPQPRVVPRVAPQPHPAMPIASRPQHVAPPTPPQPRPVTPAAPLPSPAPPLIPPPMLSQPAVTPRPSSFPHAHGRDATVEGTKLLERPTPLATAPRQEEGTTVLSSHEMAEALGPAHGHDVDEGAPDATTMLRVPESATPVRRSPQSVRVVREDQWPGGSSRAGSVASADHARPVMPAVPVVTGGTERMSPEDVRMLLAGLGSSAPAGPSPTRAPEPGVEPTQMLEIEPGEDLEDERTTTFSAEQVRAFRRAFGRRPDEE